MKTLEFIVQEIPEESFDLHEVLVSPVEINLEIEEVEFVGLIHGKIQLSRYVEEVYVKGYFSALIDMECRRCIERFESGIEAEVEVQFYPTEEVQPTDPSLIDTGERYYVGNTVDLSEDVRQALALEIPVWFLCSESCEGLCPHCGENLNITDCRCHVTDSRTSPFAALASMLNSSDEAFGDGS